MKAINEKEKASNLSSIEEEIQLKVLEGIRPGTVMFTLGYGQWGNGAADMVVDGQNIKGDGRRGQGIHANAVMGIDPHLKNTCLTDPVGGSAVFYDTHVKMELFNIAPAIT
ncbi:MAG: hypothetical protein WD097_03020 [Balneolales bacterium]